VALFILIPTIHSLGYLIWKELIFLLWGADYEKPMRTWHKHNYAQKSAEWIWHSTSHRRGQGQMKCSSFSLDVYIQRIVISGFSYYNVMLLPKNCCSTSLFTVYKRLAEGRCGWFVDWLALAACKVGGCCCVSASLRSKLQDRIKKTWDSASLRTKTLKNRKEVRF
jgi:hypothetical protein